jgi:benzoate-CoA ligase family protein
MGERRHNLAQRLAALAARSGWLGRVAFLVEGRAHSHGEVHDGAARTATLLARRGVRPGDRVLIALPDGVEFAWAFLGAARLGAIAVPVNPQLAAAEHAAMAEDVTPSAIVCTEELAGRFTAAAPAVLLAEGLAAALPGAEPAPAAPVTPETPAYAQFTSGTTGRPKAALHRHRDLEVYFRAFARRALALREDDVVLSASKLYFAYGLGNSLGFPLQAGAAAVLHPGRPRPEEVAVLLERHQPTILFAVPTLYANLLAFLAGSGGRPPRSLRLAVSAGEALLPALAERVRAAFGCLVLDGLGSTEVGQTFVSNTPDAWRDGTVGRPLPPYQVEIRSDEEDPKPCPPGEQGVLWVNGPTVLLGYWNNPQATAAVLRGGWLRSGDLAVVDGDGFVRMAGRADDLENVGGLKLAPAEVERLLAGHEGVTEVAVAAVRDQQGGSHLRAFVVAGPAYGDEAARAALAAELLARCRAELSAYKVPRAVTFLEALPRTPTGKLRRFMLRAWRPDVEPEVQPRA